MRSFSDDEVFLFILSERMKDFCEIFFWLYDERFDAVSTFWFISVPIEDEYEIFRFGVFIFCEFIAIDIHEEPSLIVSALDRKSIVFYERIQTWPPSFIASGQMKKSEHSDSIGDLYMGVSGIFHRDFYDAFHVGIYFPEYTIVHLMGPAIHDKHSGLCEATSCRVWKSFHQSPKKSSVIYLGEMIFFYKYVDLLYFSRADYRIANDADIASNPRGDSLEEFVTDETLVPRRLIAKNFCKGCMIRFMFSSVIHELKTNI